MNLQAIWPLGHSRQVTEAEKQIQLPALNSLHFWNGDINRQTKAPTGKSESMVSMI